MGMLTSLTVKKIKKENNLQVEIHDGKQIIGGRGEALYAHGSYGGLGSFLFQVHGY